jgi:hypothetical protein
MNRILTIIALLFATPVWARGSDYIMIIDDNLKLMLYDRGLFINSWSPYQVDGFALGQNAEMSFIEFSQKYFVPEENVQHRIDFFC